MADPPDDVQPGTDHYLYEQKDIEEQRMKEAILGANAAAVEKLLLCDPEALEAVFDYSFEDSDDFAIEGSTPLILAAGLGYYTISRLLLAKGANIYAETTSRGTNAFMLACIQGHMEIAKLIFDIAGPCLLELLDKLKRTPLMVASVEGAFEACQFLLEKGADIDKRDPKGLTVLHFATRGGKVDIVKLFLETKSDLLDLQTENLETALLQAAECGQSDVFHYLVGRKADITMRASGQNTVLHIAVKGAGSLDIVESLLQNDVLERELVAKGLQEKGTSVLELPNASRSTPILIAADGGNSDAFHYLLSKGADIAALSSYGHTILHLAAREGKLDVVETILRKRSDFLDVRNEFEETPLFLAADNGNYDVFRCLLEANADMTAIDIFENNILHTAAGGGNLDIVRVILEQKSEFLELLNDDGNTPLLVAVNSNELEVADFLLSQGAHIDLKGENGEKLFRAAAGYGHLGIVQKLLNDRHELLELPSENDETPLLIAAKQRRLEVVKLLCRHRADVNTQDAWGETPLSRAIQFGAIPVVKYLLSNGADPNIIDYHGNNSLHTACCYGSTYMTNILFDFLANQTQEDGLRTAITARDDDGDAPLYDAAEKERNDPSIVFLLLESDVYFPRNPAQQRGCLASSREKEILSPWLRRLINERASILSQGRMRAIIYWALLNGDVDLVTLANKTAGPIKLDRKGATWMHVVALIGNTKMLSNIGSWKSRILEEMGTNDKVTPMIIAVKEGNTKMVREFLNHLDHTDCLEVLVQVPNQEEGLIWHAAVNRRIQSEDLLWDRLFKIAKEQEDAFQFTHPHSQNAEFIMGLAAWRYTTGEGKHINRLMHHIEERLQLPARETKRSPLQFIVDYKFPVALWWLLSSGLYFGESHLIKGKASMFKWTRPGPPEEKKARDLIRGLLNNSPPERPRLKFETPSLEFQFQKSDHDWQWATVLDLTIREHKVTVQFTQSSMSQIVYGKGPDDIMRENKNYNLQEIQNILFDKKPVSRREKAKAKRRPEDNSAPNDLNKGGDRRDDREPGRGPQRKIRWIHVPANNMHLVEELMVRISKDKGMSNAAQKYLMDFVHKSRSRIAAGGQNEHNKQNHYMKPQYQNTLNNTIMGYDAKETTQYEQVEGDFEMHALYMPYLFWDKEPGHTEPTFERKPSSPRASREDMSHYFATVEPRDHEVSNPVKTSEVLGTSVEPETSPQFQVTLTQGIDLVENIGSNIQEKIEQETDYGSVEVEGESQIREKAKADAKNFIHKPLTLDQYYYASLRDTLARDQDQVLGRYFRMLGADTGKTNPQDEGQQELNYGKAPNLPLENKQQLEDSSDKNLKAAPAQILMVNQLWLWILHDDTIITSTTTQPRNFKTTFLQRVLDLLQEQNGRSKLTALQIADLAMNTATGFFDAQEIVIYEEQAQPQDEDYDDDQSEEDKVNWSEHKSPLDIFRESIQNIRDNEATLFTLFKDSIESPDGSKIMKHSMSPKGVSGNNRRFTIATRSHRFHERIWGILKQCWRSLSQPIEDNPYEDIVQETKLLNEVKDILDELNILKKLSQDQEHVRSLWTDHVDTSGFNPLVTPNERTKEIESMSEDAKSVQDDIKTLLDLKQKEATIIEAQATRRQSDSVMVFTVVTVVFLPASFLASLFALDVAEFPHEGDNVVFQGKWIFPIIFGVSLAFSLVSVPLAFNATLFRNLFSGRPKQKKIDPGSRRKPDSPGKPTNNPNIQVLRYRGRTPKKSMDLEMGQSNERS